FGRPRFNAAVTRALERLSALDALTMQRTLASMADDRRQGSEPGGELSIPTPARPGPPRRLGVRTGEKVVLVDVDAVDWVEASGDYARIRGPAELPRVAAHARARAGP